MAYAHTRHEHPAVDQRGYTVYTVRLPLRLARAIREAADQRYEPASVLVRRLVQRGLEAEAGGHQ